MICKPDKYGHELTESDVRGYFDYAIHHDGIINLDAKELKDFQTGLDEIVATEIYCYGKQLDSDLQEALDEMLTKQEGQIVKRTLAILVTTSNMTALAHSVKLSACLPESVESKISVYVDASLPEEMVRTLICVGYVKEQ